MKDKHINLPPLRVSLAERITDTVMSGWQRQPLPPHLVGWLQAHRTEPAMFMDLEGVKQD